MHQCVLNLMGKGIKRNRTFAEYQSISPKIFIHHKGKNRTSQRWSLADATFTEWLRLALAAVSLSPAQPASQDALRRASRLPVGLFPEIHKLQLTNPNRGRVCKVPDRYSSKVIIKVMRDKEGARNCQVTDQNSKEKQRQTQLDWLLDQNDDISGNPVSCRAWR